MKQIGLKTRLLAMATATAVAGMLASCDHKELCYEHPHATKIRVVYDWSEAPDANPAGMCAYFYRDDNSGAYWRFDFPGARSGEIEIPEGRYMVITYNNDTEVVNFTSRDNFYRQTARTREGDILEPMYGNGVTSSARADNEEKVVVTPDALWGCTATEVEITSHGVTYVRERLGSRAETYDSNGDQLITFYPHDMLCHYSYEVRNVTNVQHISRVSGALSGMSGSMNLSTGDLDPEPVTLPVGGRTEAGNRKVTGEFLTFGHNPANGAAHKMSFYVVMDDGAKYSFTTAGNLDVTAQVDTAPNPRRVHIIIDGLDVPEPLGDGSGFNPWVSDWGVVEEDIIVNTKE